MEAGTRTNIKRITMTLVPGITPPLTDVAISNVCLASISTSNMKVPKKQAKLRKDEGMGTFTLKRMDSGDWGERSLMHPIERKYKGRDFEDPNKWRFDMECK